VLVHGDRELDFLENDDFLLLAGGALAFVLFVQELAVILDAADGRDGIGRDLDEVETALTRDLQSFKRRQNAELLAVFVDDADLACANSFVGTDKLLGRTLIDGFPPEYVAPPRSYSV
jgi:hypothetical protein